LCDWSTIDAWEGFTADRSYTVADDYYNSKMVETALPKHPWEATDVTLGEECNSLLHATIDVQMVSGRWNVTWNSTEYENGWYEWSEHTRMWFITDDEYFKYIVFNISQEQFVDSLQFEFETNEQVIHFQMRIALRDGDNNVIDHLSQEWTQTVKGNGETPPCSDSFVTFES
jgi:hypothetical protein